MTERAFRNMIAVMTVIVLWGLMFSCAAHAQTHGNEWTLFSFTTPTTLADSTCTTIAASQVEDLFECVVIYRAVGDSTWREYDHLPVTEPRGSEGMRFRFRPPGTGWWEIGVYASTGHDSGSCLGQTVTGYWNLNDRPDRINLREGM